MACVSQEHYDIMTRETGFTMRKILLSLALLLILACNLPTVSPTPLVPTPPPPDNPSPVPVPTPVTVPATETVAPLVIVPIPMTVIQMDGVAYQTYQMPGDPFRFLCQEPCQGDPNLIHAQYAGFRRAREKLIQVMGVDTLPELQPVDIHLSNDVRCGTLAEAGALSFADRVPNANAYVCTFIFEYAQASYTPEDAASLSQQLIFIHEYLHTIFFGRVPGTVWAMHDLVTPLAEYVAHDMKTDEELCSYYPGRNPGDFNGSLLKNLCAQNGFSVAHLPPLMTELDALTQSGAGQSINGGYQHPVPSMLQFRDILNRVLGSDTTPAFAQACWPPEYFDNAYSLPPVCLVTPTVITPTPVR
jgi:hypothetical protein